MNFGGIVNQGPDDHYQNQQSRGQSPWDKRTSRRPLTPPALPPQWQSDASQRDYLPPRSYPASTYYSPAFPSPGHRPTVPPTQRKRSKRTGKRNAILLAVAALFLVGVISSLLGNGGRWPGTSAALTSTSSGQVPSGLSAAEKSCSTRSTAAGDIYVRTVKHGGAPHAQRLGPQWGWDYTTTKCLTSAEMTVATAPEQAGDCTQVGYVIKNPGYDVKATRPTQLKHLAAEAGPACPTSTTSAAPRPASPPAEQKAPAETAPSMPVHPAPAAAPSSAYPPPPATCTPLTDGGNCYQPGEFCRADDHGTSGVAGDGEAIICQDNDGWRWEPA